MLKQNWFFLFSFTVNIYTDACVKGDNQTDFSISTNNFNNYVYCICSCINGSMWFNSYDCSLIASFLYTHECMYI